MRTIAQENILKFKIQSLGAHGVCQISRFGYNNWTAVTAGLVFSIIHISCTIVIAGVNHADDRVVSGGLVF